MTFLNALGIPAETFGPSGIRTGNLIVEALAKENKELRATYDPNSRKIIILNSRALPHSTLISILSGVVSNTALNYHPLIKEAKGADENWQITLVYSEPVRFFVRESNEARSCAFRHVSNDGRNWPIAIVLPHEKH